MTAREYLSQAYRLEQRIILLKDEIETAQKEEATEKTVNNNTAKRVVTMEDANEYL